MCTSMSHFTTSLKIARVLYYVSSEFEKPPQKNGKAKIKMGSPTRGGASPIPKLRNPKPRKTKKHLIHEGGPLNTLQVLNALE